KRQNGIKNKLRLVCGSTALMDQDIRPELEKRFFQKNTSREKFNSSFKKYINTQLFVVALILMFFSAYFSHFDWVEKIIVTLVVLITLVNIGALLEQRKWIYYLEYIRVMLIIGFTFYEFGYTELVYIPILVLIIL